MTNADIHRCWSHIGFAEGTLRWFMNHSDLSESERKQAQEAYTGLEELFETLQKHFSG